MIVHRLEEIAAGGATRAAPKQHAEIVLILDGRGATHLSDDAGKELSFEWQKGALFVVPAMTCRLFNMSGQKPVRYLAVASGEVAEVDLAEFSLSSLGDDGMRLSSNVIADVVNLPLRPASELGPGHGFLDLDIAGVPGRLTQMPAEGSETRYMESGDIVAVLSGGLQVVRGEGDSVAVAAGAVFSAERAFHVQLVGAGSRPARILSFNTRRPPSES